MSNYTTGEMAKLCGVTVRTVQYYDTRGILMPSALTEGGRRLYSEEDLKRLRVICFLRELDLPLNSIGRLLAEEEPGRVIDLLLEQQAQLLRQEIRDRQGKLARLEQLHKQVRSTAHFSVESIGDIAYNMENRKRLYKIRGVMLAAAVVMEAIEIGTLILWIRKGIWQPFAAGLPVLAAIAVWISRYYLQKVAYLCPKCHKVFRPGFKEAFWAAHTPTTRRLTCPECGHKGFCVETAALEE